MIDCLNWMNTGKGYLILIDPRIGSLTNHTQADVVPEIRLHVVESSRNNAGRITKVNPVSQRPDEAVSVQGEENTAGFAAGAAASSNICRTSGLSRNVNYRRVRLK